MASFRQRGKKKTWDYRIFDNTGKVIASNSGFRTKREAIIEAQEIENKLLKHNYTVRLDNKVTLYELWKDWFELIIKPSEKAESTKNGYYCRGQVIKEYLSSEPVVKITHSDYQSFLNEYGKTVTKDYLSRLNSEIRSILNFNQRSGMMLTDFTDGVKVFGNAGGDVDNKYLHSISDYKKLLFHLKDKFYYRESVMPYLLYLLFKTGFRVGEGMAVCWSDVDFENKVIYTHRRYSGDKQKFVPAKTDTSIRSIPVDDELLKVLQELRKEQDMVLFDREEVGKEDMVFYDRRYKIPTNSGLNKYLRVCLEELGIGNQEMTATAGRHTYGSYLLSQGIDIWVVAKILGHKDIQQIIKTYGHALQEIIDTQYEVIRKVMVE